MQQACGYVDAYPVATEPFSEWVISGGFPAGRPRWEEAGATIVAEVGTLRAAQALLLNGSHSMLAYAGSIRGYSTIDEAIADPAADPGWRCSGMRQAAISPSRPQTSPTTGKHCWRASPTPRAGDQLARIAADGSTKLVVRTLPTIRAERAAGGVPIGCATTIAAWVLHLRGLGAPINDPGAGCRPEGSQFP